MAFGASYLERGVMVALNGNSGGMLLISGGPSNVGLPESTVFLHDYRVKFVEWQFPQH